MSVSSTDNTASFLNGKTQAASVSLRLIADAVVAKAEPKTPKRRGNLRRDVIKQVLGLHSEIRWDKNYAAIQESKQFQNYTTPGTGPHFAENAVNDVAAQAEEQFKQAGLI